MRFIWEKCLMRGIVFCEKKILHALQFYHFFVSFVQWCLRLWYDEHKTTSMTLKKEPFTFHSFLFQTISKRVNQSIQLLESSYILLNNLTYMNASH